MTPREKDLSLPIEQVEEEMIRAMQAAVEKYPTLEEAAAALIKDPRSHVRVGGACWPEARPSDLEFLSTDPSVCVRLAVTENANTSTKILIKLAQADPDIIVREQAALNLKKRMH